MERVTASLHCSQKSKLLKKEKFRHCSGGGNVWGYAQTTKPRHCELALAVAAIQLFNIHRRSRKKIPIEKSTKNRNDRI